MSLHDDIMPMLQFGPHGMPTAVRKMAVEMDELEKRLERCREDLGFGPEWSPLQDRRSRTAPLSPVTWSDKAKAMNGAGDMQTFVGDMAAGIDVLEAKLGEIEAAIASKRKRA